MHYPRVLGMKNRTVIRPKPGLYSEAEINAMGQRAGLSVLDIEDIQKYYECGTFYSPAQLILYTLSIIFHYFKH